MLTYWFPDSCQINHHNKWLWFSIQKSVVFLKHVYKLSSQSEIWSRYHGRALRQCSKRQNGTAGTFKDDNASECWYHMRCGDNLVNTRGRLMDWFYFSTYIWVDSWEKVNDKWWCIFPNSLYYRSRRQGMGMKRKGRKGKVDC